MIKRNHKMLDYDRFRTNLTKLQGKAEKSISEEKQIYKVCDFYHNKRRVMLHWLTFKFLFLVVSWKAS
jgi:hypothetical protein